MAHLAPWLGEARACMRAACDRPAVVTLHAAEDDGTAVVLGPYCQPCGAIARADWDGEEAGC